MSRDSPEQQRPEWQQRKERGSTFLLKIMCRLSLLLGRRVSRVILYGIALYFTLAVSSARRASRAYLARVLPRRVRWTDCYRHILAFSTTIHDRIYLLNGRYDLFDIRASGIEKLCALHANHNGGLLFGAHLGSFEMLRSLARDTDAPPVCIAMYADNARRINDALAAINPAVVQDIIPLGQMDSVLTIRDRIADGALVGILADRASAPDSYLELPFLGAPARFPTGPFRMAVMLQKPVWFMAGLYRGSNRYDVQFELLQDCMVAPAGNREQAVRELLTKYVAALERHCRAAPYNWFNFFDFWKNAGDETS